MILYLACVTVFRFYCTFLASIVVSETCWEVERMWDNWQIVEVSCEGMLYRVQNRS
jgi:hypothetical protein